MDPVKDSFSQFLDKSKQIGDVVSEIAVLVQNAVQSHWSIVDLATKSKKPSTPNELQLLLKPTGQLIQQVEEFKQKHRAHSLFNHLAAISESIPALAWLAISPTPAPYVKEMIDAAQFYTNKVLVAYKDKNRLHIEWAQSWLTFLQELQKYIRQHHTTGLVWNQQGGDFNQTAGSMPPPPPPPPAAGAMPPPPPPPIGNFSSITDSADAARSALLRDLNQGTDITKSLRKVTKEDRSSVLTTPMSDRSSRSKTPDPRATPAMNRIPKFEFEGRKWVLEYHTNQTQEQFIIQATEMNQSVNIYRCEKIMVIVQGKVNSITVDSCKKLSLVFDDIVSLVEFINCQSIQAQPMSKVPTITVDKTDGIQLFLRKESLDVELVSAKSAEINVCVIDEKTGDYKEHAIPEQLKTVWANGHFKTEALDKA